MTSILRKNNSRYLKLVACQSLPICLQQYSHLPFLLHVEKDDRKSVMGVKVYNKYHGSIWLLVIFTDSNRLTIHYNGVSIVTVYTVKSLFTPAKILTDAFNIYGHIICSEKSRNNMSEVINSFFRFILNNSFYRSGDTVADQINTTKISRIYDSVFNSHLFDDDITILTDIQINPIDNQRDKQRLVSLSGYERDFRFIYHDIYEKTLKLKNSEYSYLMTGMRYVESLSPDGHSADGYGDGLLCNTTTGVGYIIAAPKVEQPYSGALFIVSMAVDPLYRRKGYGEMLVKHLINTCTGYDDFIVIIPDICIDLCKFFTSCGFSVVGECNLQDHECFSTGYLFMYNRNICENKNLDKKIKNSIDK